MEIAKHLYNNNNNQFLKIAQLNYLVFVETKTRNKLTQHKLSLIISAFNGDNFAFAAPEMYIPMKKMVKQIDDDSFDEEKLAFKNKLGYYSQWFTKEQILELLHSDAEPIPINVSVNNNNKTHTLGHIFSNRSL